MSIKWFGEKNKMKILVISEVFWPENFLINDLVREWKKLGYEVDVVSQYPSYPESYVYKGYVNKGNSVELWEGSKIFRFPFVEGYKDSKIKKFANYLMFIFKSKSLVKQILMGGGYDNVFISQTGPLTVALPAVLNKRRFSISLSIWTFDIWPDVVYQYGVPKLRLINYLLSKLIKFVYKHCDNIFVSSKNFINELNKYTNKEIVYAPNWLQESEQKTSSLRLDSKKINFTFTGNISRYQNLLLTAMGFVKADIPNAILNIVGNGSTIKELVDYVTLNNINNVILHGRKPSNEINDILDQSDVLVLPLIDNETISKTEPLKLQSYLKAGKPIFGILKGSCKEIIEENHLGICANPSDIDSIAQGFKDMLDLSDKDKLSIRQSAHNQLQTRFNKEQIVKTITDKLSPP